MVQTGSVLASRYEILEKIGTGGMSDVYKAKDLSLGREVALKVLKDEFVTDMGFVSKFRAEATAAAGLEHPNIVNVYDVGNEDGHHFIVMEYIEGITLKTYISKKGHLSTNELLSIAIGVGRGIEAAHNKNIIHRDIKPQNIIISREGKVKVTDFGIARAVSSNTINADRMGSVHYSSPEQTRNGQVTYQSDVYSLGVVMYEMATGRVPFDGDTTVSVAIQHLQSEMTPPSHLVPGIPISVEKIILRATMKATERRYESITQMLTDLKKALINPDEDFVYIPPASVSVEQTPVVKHKDPVIPPVILPPEPDGDYDDDDDDDDGGISRKMDKAITIMGIAAAIVIILIVIYLLGSFLGLFGFRSKKNNAITTSTISAELIKVPSVLGKTEDEAKKIIEDAGFVFKKIGEASSDEYEEGEVMSQTPEAKTDSTKGSTISVTISSGVGEKSIPSVVGYEQEAAIKTIEAAGFKASTQTEYSASVEQGKVIRQSPAGTEKGKDGDIITIWVSRGKELAMVPNVVNYTENDATNALNQAGFKVDVRSEKSETVPAGNVIRQSPTGQAEQGSIVTITISEGPDTKYYSFEHSVSPNGEEPVIAVLCDPSGNEIPGCRWTVTSPSSVKASNITFEQGVLIIYAQDGRTELSRESVKFTKQN